MSETNPTRRGSRLRSPGWAGRSPGWARRRWALLATLAMVCVPGLVFSPGPVFAGELAVEGAWIRLPPPGANTAAYMTLSNPGEEPIRVTGVRCDSVERLELHETKIEDGVARMRRIDVLEVPAGGSVVLAPRGLHLMLIRPGTLEADSTLAIVFEIEGGEPLSVQVPVRRTAPSP